MNQVALVGNITDDPELRYTQSGAALANFTVAVSHRRWVPSSVGSASPTATSTAKAETGNGKGSSRAASQPSGSEDRRRSDEKHNGEWQDDGFFRCPAWRSVCISSETSTRDHPLSLAHYQSIAVSTSHCPEGRKVSGDTASTCPIGRNISSARQSNRSGRARFATRKR